MLASQAFGAALCPTICDNLYNETVENTSSNCHQEEPTEQSGQEMPADCNIMVMLDALSTFNVTSSALEVTKFDFEKDLFKATEDSQSDILALADQGLLAISKSPPIKKRPIYILIQSFLI